MIKKKNVIYMLVFGFIFTYLLYAGVLKAADSVTDDYILEKTEDFNISYPLEWGKRIKDGVLMIMGPTLIEEKTRPRNPIITVKKTDDEASAKKTKENYIRWKNLPDIKDKMLGFLIKNLVKDYRDGRYEFISSDFTENKDFIMLHTIDIDKERNVKLYTVDFITKAEPVKSYNMIFICIEEYYDKYLPVFERCIESFNTNR